MNEFPLSRTAIALNNLGVELLQRRCYAQAAATFHDATRVMKGSLVGDQDDFKYCLKNAELRLCRPEPMDTDAFVLMPLESDHTFLSSLEHRQPSQFYTIRISDETICFHNANLQTCIILYNSGLAHCLVSSRKNCTSIESVSLLHLAYNVLQGNFGNEKDTELLQFCTHIRIATLQCLAYATPAVRTQCQLLLDDLRTVARELQECTDQIFVSHSAATA